MFKALILVLICTFLSVFANADYIDTDNVTVELISVWSNDGGLLVQTSPKPNISTLSCTNDYWLVLQKDEGGYEAILSMLLAAQLAKTKITVRAEDNGGEVFCKLSRVITKAS